MNDTSAGQEHFASVQQVGARLRAAREAQGLSLAEVGSATRIPLRHLEALEEGDFSSLPSPTYAVGFSRAYARVVGVDEVGVAQAVRSDINQFGQRTPDYVPYETADPARVPSRSVAIIGAGVALAILLLAGLWFGSEWLQNRPASPATENEPVTAAAPDPAAQQTPAAAATPAAPTGGQVTLTANDEVWLRVYDAANKTLYMNTMKPGERFDIPADANDPMINVGRPDKLSVTLNGSAIPPLGTGERPIKDVKVSGTAIAARLAAAGSSPAAPADAAAGTGAIANAAP